MWGITITARPQAPQIADGWKKHAMKLAATHTCSFAYTHICLERCFFSEVFVSEARGRHNCVCVFFLFIFHVSPLRQTRASSVFLKDMLIPPPLSVLSSSLLPFLCDSLILCPSYGLRVSPHFIDSVGALPYPSPELHSAWPIPIRQRPCHEQKSDCDQACIQLPMSLLVLATPACCSCCKTVWTGLRFLSLVGRGRVWWMWTIQFRVEGVNDKAVGCRDTCTLSLTERKLRHRSHSFLKHPYKNEHGLWLLFGKPNLAL